MQEHKLAHNLRKNIEQVAADEEEAINIIVRMRTPLHTALDTPVPPTVLQFDEAFITRALEATPLHPRHTFQLVPAIATTAKVADIVTISRNPLVEHIWADEMVYVCLDSSVPVIRAPKVWEGHIDGQGIKIGLIDTGIDPTHADFAGRIGGTTDFTGEGFRDNHGHGTHVASIAAGSGAASAGRYRGVAPAAEIFAAKVLRGTGSGLMSDVMAGIEWAVTQGVQVINLSLGTRGPCDGSDAISATCNAAVEKGHVVCVAAGNEGPADATVGSPGCALRPITVGASTDDDHVAGFSSRGPTGDGRVKPDLLLPGTSIIAARAAGTQMGTPIDDQYTLASGTSMATPHATGVVALLLQTAPSLTPDEVKRILTQSANDLNLPANTQGAGRADAYSAFLLAQGQPPEPPPPPPPSPPTPPPGRPGCSPAQWSFWKQRK
ncbi:MAG: S8 family peptidase [Chloroflexi bacterium]|nr:S8 family peptidase [Chloroflexota bacterium]